MDGILDHQLICRACLRIVENKSQSFGFIEDSNGNLKDMIMCCVPEMDIYVSSQPIMCIPCIQLLVTVYNFKTRCLNTETIIRSYIQRNNLLEYNHVNLSCVVQDLVKLNNYFREMQNKNKSESQQPNNTHLGIQFAMPTNQVGDTNYPMPQIKEGANVAQYGLLLENNVVDTKCSLSQIGEDQNLVQPDLMVNHLDIKNCSVALTNEDQVTQADERSPAEGTIEPSQIQEGNTVAQQHVEGNQASEQIRLSPQTKEGQVVGGSQMGEGIHHSPQLTEGGPLMQHVVDRTQIGERSYPSPHPKEAQIMVQGVERNQTPGGMYIVPQPREVQPATQPNLNEHQKREMVYPFHQTSERQIVPLQHSVEGNQLGERIESFYQATQGQTIPQQVERNQMAAMQQSIQRHQIIERNYPPPQMREQQNIVQYGMPRGPMGQRIYTFPQPNMEQRVVRYGPPMVNQMGERFYYFPRPNMEQRVMPPYSVPGQIRHRFYPFPQINGEQRVVPYRVPVPGHQIGERVYFLPQMRPEHNIGQYGLLSNQLSQPPYHPQLMQKEQNVAQQSAARSESSEAGSPPQMQREENGASEVTSRNLTAEEGVAEKLPVENGCESNGSETNQQAVQETPVENRVRIVIKIDKNKIVQPYDKNEDSNEKENEQQDVEMTENGMPPPDTSMFLYPSDSQELYQCSNCTFVTTNLNYHIAHKKICLNELDKNEKKCPHCPHVTNRQYALNKHINTMHTRSIWYTCEYCTYRSTDSSCLRRHKRNVHPEIVGNELTCHMCSYRCTTEYHLRKHLLKHDENTILQCQFCSYSTRDRSNFRKHIFIHNPKAQDCEFCDYKCVSPYQMKVHLKKYHHGVGLEDIDCRSDVSISEVVDDISNAINESKSYIGHLAE